MKVVEYIARPSRVMKSCSYTYVYVYHNIHYIINESLTYSAVVVIVGIQ